ncbi:MAG: DUF3021 family protein [Lachnospiraceae bacterium]|nr:DUF3021 family protein [Lachnospiraceae bacterium]MDE6185789.1 DUF3021 family protein [Lachnospiraceae bacterium]
MKDNKDFLEPIMAFLVCTACITILEGVVGMILYPEQKFGYDAFLSPPLFGFCSVLLGIVTYSKKELSVKQVLIRRGIHLLLIEGLILGVNYVAGIIFEPLVFWMLVAAIALVFVTVYVVLWLNDKRSAAMFNEQLKRYQQQILETENRLD